MNRCTIFYGSGTAQWHAAATRSHRARPPGSLELQTKWKRPRACQRRHISMTASQSPQSEFLGVGDENPAESATDTVKAGEDASSMENGSMASSSGPSSELAINSTSTSNAPTTESPSIPKASHKPPFRRRPLPLSPLMDPAFLEARQKHHNPKLPPTKTPTAFQQQLAKNPFALALSTPVRRCGVSGTKLPTFFLQRFRVMSDPKTGDPWYVPSSLAKKHLPKKERNLLDGAEETEELKELEREEKLDALKEPENGTPAEEKPKPSKIGYQAYTLNRKYLLHSIVDLSDNQRRSCRRGPSKGHHQLLPGRWREIKSAMKTYSRSGWRPDMEDFLPMLMGRRISEALVHLCGLKRGYLVGCCDWEDALKKPQVAAFLWTGNKGDQDIKGPSDFATLDVGSQNFGDFGPQLGSKKRKVLVYNLQTLLGKEKIEELRIMLPKGVFEREIVVLKHKNATVELQSQLWKIQGYLAELEMPESDMDDDHADESIEHSEPSRP